MSPGMPGQTHGAGKLTRVNMETAQALDNPQWASGPMKAVCDAKPSALEHREPGGDSFRLSS